MLSTKNTLKKMVKLLGYELTKINQKEELLSSLLAEIYAKYSYYTMIPKSIFVENLRLCQRFNHIKGSIVECGVWRGGMIAALAEILGNDRNYYLFDSFEGLPEAKEIDGEAAKKWQKDKEGFMYHDNCKAKIDDVDKAMKLSGTKSYQIIQGWFYETLEDFYINEQIAILRLDADWYKSTIECLNFLYPKVAIGGLIILDDYYTWDGCSRALHDYLSTHSISSKIFQIEGNCYIVKT